MRAAGPVCLVWFSFESRPLADNIKLYQWAPCPDSFFSSVAAARHASFRPSLGFASAMRHEHTTRESVRALAITLVVACSAIAVSLGCARAVVLALLVLRVCVLGAVPPRVIRSSKVQSNKEPHRHPDKDAFVRIHFLRTFLCPPSHRKHLPVHKYNINN